MSLYGQLKRVYKAVTPRWIQRRASSRDFLLGRLAEPFKVALRRGASHDEIYDRAYFAGTVDEHMQHSAEVMAKDLAARFHPGSVIDVGCGTGALLAALKGLNVKVLGLEKAEAAIAIARSRGLEVVKIDLEAPVELDLKADLAISTEVAEHLPAAWADRFVALLCSLSDRVLLTAAPPGQGGLDHVNEQPNEYWIEKFQQQGLAFDSAETARTRDAWRQGGAAHFYFENVMAFRRSS